MQRSDDTRTGNRESGNRWKCKDQMIPELEIGEVGIAGNVEIRRYQYWKVVEWEPLEL